MDDTKQKCTKKHGARSISSGKWIDRVRRIPRSWVASRDLDHT